MEKRKTVGEEIIEKNKKPEENPECREVTLEWGKAFNQRIEKIIEEHKNYAKKYYIVIFAHKEIFSEQVVRTKWIVRKTIPYPEWRQCVYSYNNETDELLIHWCLPNKETAYVMLMHKEGFDSLLIEWIEEFIDGRLKKKAEDLEN